MFISEAGKFTRTKHFAWKREKFVLILAELSKWEQFIDKRYSSSAPQYETLTPIRSENPKIKFNTLIWVNSELVRDIALNRWYKLLELYPGAGLNIASYLAPSESLSHNANTAESDLCGNTSSKEQEQIPAPLAPLETVSHNANGLESDLCADTTIEEQIPAPALVTSGGVQPSPAPNGDSSKDKACDTVNSNNLPNKISSKFKSQNVGGCATEFIQENQSQNTKRSSKTILNLFSKFLKEVHPELSENVLEIEVEKLPDLVTELFMCLQKNEEESYNVSTLKTYYNSLSRILLEEKKICLKTNPDFQIAKKVLQKQQRISKQNGEIPGKHASNAIPPEVLAKCWESGAFGKSNPRALTAAVIVHIQSMFGTRAMDELFQMRNQDLVPAQDRGDGLPAHIAFSERLTKTRTGETGQGIINLHHI